MAFTNTVDSIGNGALTDSIINRSITELADNIIDTIGASAFRGCSSLKEVNLPNVKSIALAAFWQCTALEKADFSGCVSFSNNAFYGCQNLKALILRNTSQVCTATGTPFAASAIAGGTGYIYVPKALESTYKAASGWSTYAAQIRAIDDYPGICDPYSWAGVAANIADGSYKSVYKLGDLVPLDLGSEGVVNMQIVAFDADDKADGSGKAAISWVGKDLLATRHRWNPECVKNDDGKYQEGTGSVGGWEKSEMRSYLQNTIKPLIPENVRSMIKTVTKYSLGYNTSAEKVNNMVTSDDVWIPSYREKGSSSSTQSETNGPMYTKLEPNSVDTLGGWWLRTASSYNNVRRINSWDTASATGVQEEGQILIGFCT